MILSLAPYLGVLAGVVCAWIYLKRSTMPVAASGWRSAKVAKGDCPREHCGGSTYLIAANSYQTLWRCEKCTATYMLSSIPGE